MGTRRNFLNKLGLLAAATVLPDLTKAGEIVERNPKSKLRTVTAKTSVNADFDVIVVGGGPAGCTAAISAAREGAKTLLIEAMGQLGGMGTSGLVPSFCPFSDGEKIIYRGLAEQIYNEAKTAVSKKLNYDGDSWIRINPEHLTSVYDRRVTEAGVKILFFSRLAAVEKSANDTVDALIVANKAGLTAFKAKVYIDATGDGDLAAWAGAPFKLGDGKGSFQGATMCFSAANVDTHNFLSGERLHNVNPKSPIHKAVDSKKYPLIDRHFNENMIGAGVLQLNAGHLHSVDSTDPWQLSEAMIRGRQTAAQYIEAMKEFNPETFGGAFLNRTAALLGVRESRHIEGDYTFTADDWIARRSFDDEIGRNCYYIDVHKVGAKDVYYKRGESHGIPYRILTPKGLKNVLMAGRCVSADEVAFGSLRVMPPCLVTGEAAGMAAAHAIAQTRNDVHKIDVQYMRKRLKEEGGYFS
ncbi:MAG: FAD-dependent oxidoreductase [Dysgonamonadaceae bacterium]|jgi:hypothetical protein|nr:FAD-dependent oxidoreductase [Dysgonamonadaceae bacterium]